MLHPAMMSKNVIAGYPHESFDGYAFDSGTEAGRPLSLK